jgi:hypothetical protein
MRHARAAAFLVAALPVLLPATASAKIGLQGQLSLSLAWTDNILGRAETQGVSDFYASISPSLILSTGTARAVQQVSYNFQADLFFTRSEANSYSQRLTWTGFFYTTRSTDMLVTANIGQGRLNTFTLTGTSATTPIAPQPGVPVTFVNGALNETLGWDISRQLRFMQNMAFAFYTPVDPGNQPSAIEFDNHLVLERYWPTDAFGAELQSLIVDFTAVRGPVAGPDGITIDAVVSPENTVVINSAMLKWRHDFGRYFNTELDIGVVEASVAQGGPPDSVVIWQPKGLAAIRFIHDYGTADLTYQHTIAPNALVANTFATDSVELRLGLPLGRFTGLALGLSGGYSVARVIDFRTGGTFSTTQLIGADATLGYAHPKRPEIGVFARYQFFDQIATPGDIQPLPTYLRHTVMIGINGIYPAVAAAIVPRRQALRADRSDAPMIAAPHSPAPTPPK